MTKVRWGGLGVELLGTATDLFAALEEELVGVNAVGDGAANEGNPVEDEWRLRALATDGQQLREYIEDDGENESRAANDRDGEPERLVAQMRRNGVGNSGQESHCWLTEVRGRGTSRREGRLELW